MLGGGKKVSVGLLNVGTEEHKGGDLQHAAYALLKESGLNFAGNVEARDLPSHAADVVVADGFSGNVALKMMEGTADVLMGFLKGIFMTNALTKLAYLLVKPHYAGTEKDDGYLRDRRARRCWGYRSP